MITAPFGTPVLPEVKLMTAWLEGVTAALSAPAERPAQSDCPRASSPISGSSVEPVRRAPAVTDSRNSSSASTSRGRSSAVCISSSYGLRRWLRGAATAPASRQARNATTHSIELRPRIATRSPGRTPWCRRRPQVDATSAYSSA